MSRRVWFIVAVLAGVTLGLVYGWVINPVQYVETSPDTLRADYKTDYVLMVAEAYHTESDLSLAVRRLAILGNTPQLEMVQQAIVFADQSGYSPQDIDLMLNLSQGLKTWSPETQGTP
jgi:hypothetical protein